MRLRGHADVAEPGGGQHVLEPAGLAEAGAAHDLVTTLRKALQQLGGQRPEPGYALGAGPHEACEDAARMQRAPAFADAGDRIGKEHQAELAHDRVEARRATRQRLAVHGGQADAAAIDLRGGGPQHRERDVDADDTAAGADRVEHHQRRLAGAGGQVEHALATFDARRTQQCRQERARPAPDEGVVGAGDVVEGDRHHVLRYAASTARAISRVLARPP